MPLSLEEYKRSIHEKGLKSTRQRDLIVAEFLSRHQHLTAEELLTTVRRQDPTVGFSTVYRTLRLLTELGLAQKREFGVGPARFEHATERHHDHLICVKCGDIVEFENDQIEELQDLVCEKHDFTLLYHKMELYGICERCGQP